MIVQKVKRVEIVHYNKSFANKIIHELKKLGESEIQNFCTTLRSPHANANHLNSRIHMIAKLDISRKEHIIWKREKT
jgi:head-tail adaptor